MERVLVCGVKDPVGGMEQVAMEYIRNIVARHPLRFDLLVYGSEFSQQAQYEALGCRILYVPVRRRDPVGYKEQIARIFRENRYVAIWCNVSGLTNIDLLVLGKKYGVPVRIVHSHAGKLYWGSPLLQYPVRFLHWKNSRRLHKFATDYWACSDVAGKFMFPEKLQSRVERIPNAVDTRVFYPDAGQGAQVRAELGIDPNAPVIGHVARICQVKNQSFLLEVMAAVVKRCPQARLLFVGDGELREQIEAKIRQLGLEENVILTGARTDVPELLRAMNVFVLTSFSEGLSVSAVEAQASGLNCVVPTTVSRETDLIGCVTFLPLEEGPERWAEVLLQAAADEVTDAREKITAGGYDIVSAADRLYQRFIGKE